MKHDHKIDLYLVKCRLKVNVKACIAVIKAVCYNAIKNNAFNEKAAVAIIIIIIDLIKT